MMKDIEGFKGLYAITDDGEVWSYKTQKFLKQRRDKDNYLRVSLTKDGKIKTFHIHRHERIPTRRIMCLQKKEILRCSQTGRRGVCSQS